MAHRPRAINDDLPRCPSCSREMLLGTPISGEMPATCMHCNQRVTFGLREGRWIVRERSTLPAAIPD
jgi:DNA-directed RNA polymerase subunit RPC12/RpoP